MSIIKFAFVPDLILNTGSDIKILEKQFNLIAMEIKASDAKIRESAAYTTKIERLKIKYEHIVIWKFVYSFFSGLDVGIVSAFYVTYIHTHTNTHSHILCHTYSHTNTHVYSVSTTKLVLTHTQHANLRPCVRRDFPNFSFSRVLEKFSCKIWPKSLEI